MEERSTRDSYGDILLKLGSNENIVVVDGDLSISTQTNKFARRYPERFFNCGCAEQNLVGLSTGLAISGKIVFSSSYSIFLMRAWEQIRNMAHDNLNIKLCASHSGLTNSYDGSSHQCLEDIAIMRVIPNMSVINPTDGIETDKIMENETKRKGPAYIRLNRTKTPIITKDYYDANKFEIGKAIKLLDGNDLAIISTGTMVYKSLESAKILKEQNIDVSVIDINTIKPIDRSTIVKEAKRTGNIITVEEHSIYGGLGSSVAEILIEDYPVPMKIIGIRDKFGESGEYSQLLIKYGLTTDNIIKSAKELLNSKIIDKINIKQL